MISPGPTDVLIAVDVQNDFCSDGALAVPHGEDVVPAINRLARYFRHVVLTQDWHPAGHGSFASRHPGHKPFDVIDMPYGPQILWPDHCMWETPGAALRDDLDIPHAELVVRKGYRADVDSYSAFFENDHATPTGLGGYLRERGFTRIFVAGLAIDFSVRYSAEDGHASGFEVIVLEDACRGIDVEGSVAATRRRLSELEIPALRVDDIG